MIRALSARVASGFRAARAAALSRGFRGIDGARNGADAIELLLPIKSGSTAPRRAGAGGK